MILSKFSPTQNFLMAALLKLVTVIPLLPVNYLPQKPFSPSLLHDLKLFTLIASRCLELIRAWRIPITQILISLSPAPCQKNTSFDPEIFPAMETTVLDLPELAVYSILSKLSPSDLCSMACVCRSLRDKCRSDELWERHVREKWSRVVGERRRFGNGGIVKSKGRMSILAAVCPFSWMWKKMEGGRRWNKTPPINSLIDFYSAIQSGRLSFQAQVFNRENGRTGFLMSCYDAEISYNARTDNFLARYPPQGKRVAATETVSWERTRAPCVVTEAHQLHISDCLSDLNPGDPFEIQWRRNKEFPFGWWYGIVGHSEMCATSERRCQCHTSDSVVLEFKHYAQGSRWRRKIIDRQRHTEDGNEMDGFYGGIRKIHNQQDVDMWMQFWPAKLLE